MSGLLRLLVLCGLARRLVGVRVPLRHLVPAAPDTSHGASPPEVCDFSVLRVRAFWSAVLGPRLPAVARVTGTSGGVYSAWPLPPVGVWWVGPLPV